MIIFNNKKYLWLSVFCLFLIDQSTKMLALNLIPFDTEIILNKMFSIHTIYNESSIMLSHSIYEIPFINNNLQFKLLYFCFSLVLILGIVWVTNQKSFNTDSWDTEFAKSGLFIIMGGILGNVFDRIFRYEGVVDFIRLNFIESIPILNFADITIFLGEFYLIISWLIIFKNKFFIYFKGV